MMTGLALTTAACLLGLEGRVRQYVSPLICLESMERLCVDQMAWSGACKRNETSA